MPSLVVWEPLMVAGDDLFCISAFRIVLYLVEIGLVIPITYYIVTNDHDPEPYVEAGCITSLNAYYYWKTLSITACAFTLTMCVLAVGITGAICKVSTLGTPTDTDARRILPTLCKLNVTLVFVMKVIVWVLLIYIAVETDRYCNCVLQARTGKMKGFATLAALRTCPAFTEWFVLTRIFLFLISADILTSSTISLCVLRTRVERFLRRSRKRERVAEDEYKWWRNCCRACCEFSSLMTCYMFGGQHLTSSSYADVAIALTAFFEDRGSLDIVPSDIAAALICLMTIQRQKQIDCRNELLKEGGIYAKDKFFLSKLWKSLSQQKKKKALRKSESQTDIETGIDNHEGFSLAAATNDINKLYDVEGTQEKIRLSDDTASDECDHPAKNVSERVGSWTSVAPTESELDQARSLLKSSVADILPNVTFSAIYQQEDGEMTFKPVVQRMLSKDNSFDRLVLAEGSRYCRVALAAYSWMMYLWTSRCIGCCELSANTLCEFCMCRPRYCRSRDHVIGDNLCGWKQAAVLKSLGIQDRDFLFANFKNAVNICPYIVLIDRRWRNIVIVIRGTLSFEDMISDVTLSPEPLDVVGEEFGFEFDCTDEFCHKGMLEAAKFVYDDMEARGVLKKAIQSHPEFSIRVTGHSLGAGVASVLGLMMRRQYPQLKCLCFSPPGCVFTKQTAKYSEDFTYSFILHNDLIPRLSYHSLVHLRNDVIEMIARIKVPKHEVFAKNMKFRSESKIQYLPAKLLYEREEVPTSTFFNQFKRYLELQSEREAEIHMKVRMTAPGKICQLYRTSQMLNNVPCSTFLSCLKCIPEYFGVGATKKYTVRWADAEDISEIVISKTMMVDHFPYNVARALDIAAIECGVFDSKIDVDEANSNESLPNVEKKKS